MDLGHKISACRICRDYPRKSPLPHEPRPIFRISGKARLVVASQAPGLRAHTSGIPFDDPSGARLRDWMGIDPEVFYDPVRVAIVPMGFCFPGYDAHKGDLPPRAECRDLWHDRVFAAMPQVELILTVGIHAIRYHRGRLEANAGPATGMTDVVAAWRDLDVGRVPRLIPLPHPSWRNSGWLKRNPWFEAEVLPVVRDEVRRLTA
jgi:uracil-DNA glycosylase